MIALVQKNIWGEYGYDRFINALHQQDVEVVETGLIPFTTEFVDPVDVFPDYCFGSTRFVHVCREKGFPTFPSYSPNRFDIFPKENWLNYSDRVCKLGELKIEEPCFVKPFTEKFFTGLVVESNEDLDKIQLTTSFIENEKDELVLVSPVKKIDMEVRFFVLNGEVITGSVYREKGLVKHSRVYSFHSSFLTCKEMLSKATTNESFVLDLGLVEDSWKIVELNNLNSAGFYESDVDALVRALKVLKI